MVKGISRQVIVVHSPDKKLFEQAIFILNNDAVTSSAVTEDVLLKEARQLISSGKKAGKRIGGPFWAFAGAAVTGIAWLVSVLI